VVSEWMVFLKISGWTSEYRSVSKLLRHLKIRRIGSESSRAFYCSTLRAFCLQSGKTPDEIVGMEKKDVENLVEDFGFHKRETGCSVRTVNGYLAILITFFKVNGFRGDKELDIQLFHCSARARTRLEYIPTLEEASRMASCAGSLRNRAIILTLVSTGLRNSTMRAITYGDISSELENEEQNIRINVYGDMKKIVPAACKGDIEYVTFTSKEARDAILLYLADRRARFGALLETDVLFSSEYNQLLRNNRAKKPITAEQLERIVRLTARKAGIKGRVTPHCLRKTFESVLRSQLADGSRLDLKTQEYLMGHILHGSMDAYYDKTKIDELREQYSKLIFSPPNGKSGKGLDALRVMADYLKTKQLHTNSSEENGPEAGASAVLLETILYAIESVERNVAESKEPSNIPKCGLPMKTLRNEKTHTQNSSRTNGNDISNAKRPLQTDLTSFLQSADAG